MDQFKLPHSIPQDLLLIQEYVGVPVPSPLPPPPQSSKPDDGDISSSDEDNSDIASEEEIAADLIAGVATDEDDVAKIPSKLSEPLESTSGSDSDSSSSDSDADADDGKDTKAPAAPGKDADIDLLDDDEDPVPAAASGTYFQTKHEIAEAAITVPDTDEVGPDEVLEKVGEVMNTLDKVAIVRGLPSEMLNRASERALDSDTLLVFDDRKVMGYIYETFGPTSQPLYQVRFTAAYPLDPDRVRVGREVFHIPARSHFVFLSQIKAMKGSDASNVHDEEPADDELEFSDDEAEAAFRSRVKRKRGESRARSVASSRQSTPNPTLMRDQELADEAFFSRNAYDEHGPYDLDYLPGPSGSSSSSSARPAPIPYDDPYGDEYTAPDLVDREERRAAAAAAAETALGSARGARGTSRQEYDRRRGERGYERSEGQNRGRETRDRGRGRGRDRDRDRDRGGHRERGGARGRGGGGGNRDGQRQGQRFSNSSTGNDDRERERERELSPTALAIARATGQMGYASSSASSGGGQRQYGGYQAWQGEYDQGGYGYSGYGGSYTGGGGEEGWGYAGMQGAQDQQRQMMLMMQQQQYGYNTGMGMGMNGMHGYPAQPQSGYGYQTSAVPAAGGASTGGGGTPGLGSSFVQPHINPRFASAFAMGIPAGTAAGGSGGGDGSVDGPAAGSSES